MSNQSKPFYYNYVVNWRDDQDDLQEGGGGPPDHPVWFTLLDPHGELVGGADPYEVEVGEYPGQSEGEAPGDHDAEVGQGHHGHDRESDGANLGYISVSE